MQQRTPVNIALCLRYQFWNPTTHLLHHPRVREVVRCMVEIGRCPRGGRPTMPAELPAELIKVILCHLRPHEFGRFYL